MTHDPRNRIPAPQNQASVRTVGRPNMAPHVYGSVPPPPPPTQGASVPVAPRFHHQPIPNGVGQDNNTKITYRAPSGSAMTVVDRRGAPAARVGGVQILAAQPAKVEILPPRDQAIAMVAPASAQMGVPGAPGAPGAPMTTHVGAPMAVQAATPTMPRVGSAGIQIGIDEALLLYHLAENFGKEATGHSDVASAAIARNAVGALGLLLQSGGFGHLVLSPPVEDPSAAHLASSDHAPIGAPAQDSGGQASPASVSHSNGDA